MRTSEEAGKTTVKTCQFASKRVSGLVAKTPNVLWFLSLSQSLSLVLSLPVSLSLSLCSVPLPPAGKQVCKQLKQSGTLCKPGSQAGKSAELEAKFL